ncbi:MAG TPA: 3-oxoadipate enol-lactonase [Pseudorhodoplanes sp.]|jgi:3-oxoadipate enol-lactonase|nr:3-oxoadipate enol-lactonase [Pseudorhodoplanes sp.]
MTTIDTNGTTLNVEIEGPAGAPVLMLSNSLGTDLHMWDPQIGTFAKSFRVIRYDRRGHGRSGVPRGPYSMEMLGRDALGILDALGIDRASWLGLSMGGMVGQWLGANAPERIDRLILSNTNCYYPDKEFWSGRIRLLRDKGLGALVEANMERWFTREFRETSPQTVARMTETFLATPIEGYIACCEAIRDMDHRDLLARITRPTLVIAGLKDPATPVENAEFIRARVPGAKLALLDAAHIANVEQPKAYAEAVLDFLRS